MPFLVTAPEVLGDEARGPDSIDARQDRPRHAMRAADRVREADRDREPKVMIRFTRPGRTHHDHSVLREAVVHAEGGAARGHGHAHVRPPALGEEVERGVERILRRPDEDDPLLPEIGRAHV